MAKYVRRRAEQRLGELVRLVSHRHESMVHMVDEVKEQSSYRHDALLKLLSGRVAGGAMSGAVGSLEGWSAGKTARAGRGSSKSTLPIAFGQTRSEPVLPKREPFLPPLREQ